MATRKTTRRRKKKRSSHSRPQPLAGWVWMLFGLAVGLAVAAAIYVNDRKPAPATLDEPVARADRKPASAAAAPEDEGFDFDFYDVLPRFEMVIPEQDLDARPDRTPAPLSGPGPYVLQAGSFSAFAEADRRKAGLALIGIPSRIQKVTVDDKTYYRVRIGPVDDPEELNRMRARLREAKIEVMVIRVAE